MTAEEYIAAVDTAYGVFPGASLEARLLELLWQSEQEYGKISPVHAAMLSELGAYCRGQAKCDESVEYFIFAIDILRETSGEESPDYSTALNNLAGTYRQMGRYDDAEALFRQASEIYDRTLGKEHVLYAASLNNLALVCLDRGDFPRAEALLSDSSAILAALPECRDEYASSLCNRGALCCRTWKYDEAEALLSEAVTMFENELGTDTPHYHAALNTLGIVSLSRGDNAAACGFFERAYAAAKELYGTYHPETQAIMQALAVARQRSEEAK